jgi:LacI family repressor for deo operon, udp, cdd, tsx, nupC, and nupG
VGFDDIPFSRNISPSLTTVRQPRGQIGELAMSQLLDALSTRSVAAKETLLHGDLIVRDSCSTP